MARFCILLATYNGEAFLREQLESLANLDENAIDIVASDDGSSDGTLSILQEAADDWEKGDFIISRGPAKGFADNFRFLIANAPSTANYFAFCDQDDLWDANKLSIARARLSETKPGTAGLYCGRTRLIGPQGAPIGFSPLMARGPSFRNALVQSIAGANTMVMNRAAFELLKQSINGIPLVSHDWWSYLIVSGAGGTVIYDQEPRISYRQHGTNVVGSNAGVSARFRRLRALLDGRFVDWTNKNIAALEMNRLLLTPDHAAMLDAFKRARSKSVFSFLKVLSANDIRRQTALGNISLCLGALIGRI